MMDLYHKTSPQRIEAIRLFNIIQEYSENPKSILNANALSNFFRAAEMPDNKDAIKLLHQIDKEGRQMNKEYWGLCISRAFNTCSIHSTNDITNIHQLFKHKFTEIVYQPLNRFEEWDDNRGKNKEAKDATYAEILQYWEDLSMIFENIDPAGLKDRIIQINRCLSLLTLMPERAEYIIAMYKHILKGSFLTALHYTLTENINDDIHLQLLRILCYLYQSLKYEEISFLLQQSFLVNLEIMKNFISCLKENSYISIPKKYYTCIMAMLMMKRIPHARLIVLFEDQEKFLIFCKSIAMMKEQQGLYYGLQLLGEVITKFKQMDSTWQNQNVFKINQIFDYALQALKSSKEAETQVACLELLEKCVEVEVVDGEKLKNLKILTDVFQFEASQPLQTVIMGALEIIKKALCFDRIELIETILGDKVFENYILKVLVFQHKPWQPIISLLQICLILAKTKYSKLLFEKKQLIVTIMHMTLPQQDNTTNGTIMLYISQILLQLVQHSLDQEWKITYLHEKGILSILGNIISSCYCPDTILTTNYPTLFPTSLNRNIIHKQMYTNYLKTLYLLTNELKEGCSYAKKKELFIKNFSTNLAEQFWNSITQYLTLPKNQQYIAFNLKEDHVVDTNNTMKMCSLISLIIEELTYFLRKRNSDGGTLKIVHNMRCTSVSYLVDIYEHFYRILSSQELETYRIPIYLKLCVLVEGSQNIVRKKYHRLNYRQFIVCLRDVIKEKRGFNARSFLVFDKVNNKKEIRGLQDYEYLVESVLKNYHSSHFQINVEVGNIQNYNQMPVDDRSMPGFGRREVGYGVTGRQPFRHEGHDRFGSTRLPESRKASPFTYSTRGRDRSPQFGKRCRLCAKSTMNVDGVCNNCR